jgi:hypothetical protein
MIVGAGVSMRRVVKIGSGEVELLEGSGGAGG